jgi:heme exporter protein B
VLRDLRRRVVLERIAVAAQLWWMIQKDLLSELHGKRAWPAMVLLGLVVAVVFDVQTDLLPTQKEQISGALLWLAIFFASQIAIDRSCSFELVDGCWEGLLEYPVAPTMVYWAKLLVNWLALGLLSCLLIPAFAMLSGINLFRPLWAIILVALLASLGLAAVGTLLSALTNQLRQGGHFLVVVVLPLVVPVIISAAEATRLIAINQIGDDWLRWVQFLGGFAVIYSTAGTVLFEFIVED